MNTLSPRDGYRLWAPTYSAETVVTALEDGLVAEFGVNVTGERLLDAACGTGRRLRGTGARVAIGVDLTPEMLPISPTDGHFAAADVRALPFDSAEFNVIWCRLALGHISDLAASYRELARVCTAGGSVVVTDFHSAAVAAGHRRTFRDAGGVVHEIEHHVYPIVAHVQAAAAAGLSHVMHESGPVGPAVRSFYERANRVSDYEAQLGLPLVLGIVFSKHS